ncbi:hypothetical protein A9Q99_08565 [Gammaproteobacteria bacterium 45_16_T64]|nr:hypothetical protein A9Q99_08565 [Gammaproteobacteria bacterium 45_16_T64]
MSTLNERLRTARKALGLTQKELADSAGVSQVTIQHLESGRNNSSKKLLQIAVALQVSVDWLAAGDDSPGNTGTPTRSPLGSPPALAPLVLTFKQAATPQAAFEQLNNSPSAERAFLSPRSLKHFSAHAFAVYMEDNSMRSRDDREHALLNSWQEDDLLVFDGTSLGELTPGSPVIALVHGSDTTIFRKYRDKGVDHNGEPTYELIPLNEDYLSITVSAKNPATIMGVLRTTLRESHRL